MREVIDRYRILLIGLITLLLFFSVRSCVNTQSKLLEVANVALKKQIGDLEKDVKTSEISRKMEKDSLVEKDEASKARILTLNESIQASKKRIEKLTLEVQNKKGNLANKTISEKADDLNTIFGGKNATALSSSIDIKGNLPSQIITTVIDLNSLKEVVKEKDNQLQDKDEIINGKESQIVGKNMMLYSAEKTIEEQKKLSDAQDKLNSGQEKEIRKLKEKNFYNKIILPISFGVGVYLGTKFK